MNEDMPPASVIRRAPAARLVRKSVSRSAILAIKTSSYRNAVSRLHGVVSRSMWHKIWPSLPLDEIPISHITNGVHPRTWITHDMIDLLDRYFGPGFHDTPTNLEIWDRIDRVSDEELW